MRLITRSDFDGLGCAALLEELGIADDILYAHPKDIQDGKVSVASDDVLANVPFVEGCGLWFDHHSSEQERLHLGGKFKGACEMELSATRVIYNYYKKEPEFAGKLDKFTEMVAAVDKADSAQYTKEDILNPQGWMMLAFITDPRSGFGYRHQYSISNFDLMKKMPLMLRTMDIAQILADPDVAERVAIYVEENEAYKQFILDTAIIEGAAIMLDMRGKRNIPGGNRFIEYTLFPEQNISIRLADGKQWNSVMISVGHSIINTSSQVDVGSLMLGYGGGGHKKVGTCQVAQDAVEKVLGEILQAINKVG